MSVFNSRGEKRKGRERERERERERDEIRERGREREEGILCVVQMLLSAVRCLVSTANAWEGERCCYVVLCCFVESVVDFTSF